MWLRLCPWTGGAPPPPPPLGGPACHLMDAGRLTLTALALTSDRPVGLSSCGAAGGGAYDTAEGAGLGAAHRVDGCHAPPAAQQDRHTT